MRLLIAAILAAAGWTLHRKRHTAGRSEVHAQWEKRACGRCRCAQLTSRAREREQALQFTADKLRQEKSLEIGHLSAAATLLCASCATATNAPPTGAMLPPPPALPALDPLPPALELSFFRQDAAFLSGEAARADEVRAHLSECRAAYESAREVSR